jgi:hypothetical protein
MQWLPSLVCHSRLAWLRLAARLADLTPVGGAAAIAGFTQEAAAAGGFTKVASLHSSCCQRPVCYSRSVSLVSQGAERVQVFGLRAAPFGGGGG